MDITFITEKLKKVPAVYKTAFIVSLIVGLLCHMMGMTEFFLTQDTLFQHEKLMDTVSSGRFLLGVFGSLSSEIHIPWINGLIILIFLALTCAVVVSLLDVKDKFTAGIVSALLTVSPTIGYFMIWSYTGDAYAFSLFCAVLALLVTKKYKFGYFLGIILIFISVAIYQAFIMFAITLCVLLVFSDAVSNRLQFKLYGKWIITGGVGSALYLLVNYLVYSISDMEITGYQNINSLLSVSSMVSMFNINASVMQIYTVLVKQRYLTGFGVIGIIAAISTAALLIIAVIAVIKNFRNQNKSIVDKRLRNKFLMGTLIAVLSIYVGALALNILAPLGTITFHKMMQLQYMLIPIGFVIIIEKFKDIITHTIIKRIAAVASIILVFTFAIHVNVGYTKYRDMSINLQTFYSKVAYEITNTEGFKNGMDAVLLKHNIGNLNNNRPRIGTDAIDPYFRLYECIELNFLANDEEKEEEYNEIINNLNKEDGCDAVVIDDVIYIYVDGTGIKSFTVTY